MTDAATVLDTLREWGGPVRFVPGEGAHVLLLESDHTRSSLLSWEAWEHVRGQLQENGEGLFEVAA